MKFGLFSLHCCGWFQEWSSILNWFNSGKCCSLLT